MEIRMRMAVAGQFHGVESPAVGDVVAVDDENGMRYCALGYAEPVARKTPEVEVAVAPPAEERKRPGRPPKFAPAE